MSTLEEIIIKYKLQYNKDKTYFKFNFLAILNIFTNLISVLHCFR